MEVRVSVPEHLVGPETLEPLLEAVTRVNEAQIHAGQLPLADEAIAAGVRWRPEPPGAESFDHGGIVLRRGWGDCDDLAPHHAASLRATGEDPGAQAIAIPSGPQTWHAIVLRSDGTLDDPSVRAGMPTHGGMQGMPWTTPVSSRVYVGVIRQPRGWAARVDVPIHGCACGCSCVQRDADPRKAISQAAHGAMMMGQHAGAIIDDTEKLRALAMLAKGISQRQLIDHVDPDLLLCAVLLNQTIERKLTSKGVAGMPTVTRSFGRPDLAAHWKVNRPNDVPASVGLLTKAQAQALAAQFVKNQAKYWKAKAKADAKRIKSLAHLHKSMINHGTAPVLPGSTVTQTFEDALAARAAAMPDPLAAVTHPPYGLPYLAPFATTVYTWPPLPMLRAAKKWPGNQVIADAIDHTSFTDANAYSAQHREETFQIFRADDTSTFVQSQGWPGALLDLFRAAYKAQIMAEGYRMWCVVHKKKPGGRGQHFDDVALNATSHAVQEAQQWRDHTLSAWRNSSDPSYDAANAAKMATTIIATLASIAAMF